MVNWSGLTSIGASVALVLGLFAALPVVASVPYPAPLEWEDIAKILKDSTLPMSWQDSRGNSIIYYHLHFGTEADAARLIQLANSQRVRIRDRQALAYFSAMNGKEFALRELIAGGVSPNAAPGEDSLLMAAAREEHLGIMRLLIASGADVNYRTRSAIDPDGLSDAATSALSTGKDHAARLLFSSGYSPTRSGPAQTRELFFAAIAGGSAHAVRHLLENFNLIDIVDSRGETPLTFAVAAGTTDAVISELLLRGADPCKRNKANESVEELLDRLNKGKQPYDASFGWVRHRLLCQPKQP